MVTWVDLHRANHLVVEAAQRLVCKEEEARKSFLVVPYSSPVVRPQAYLTARS